MSLMAGNPPFRGTFHSQAGMANSDEPTFAQPSTMMNELNLTSLIWSAPGSTQATGFYPTPFASLTSPTVVTHPPLSMVHGLGQYIMPPFVPPTSAPLSTPRVDHLGSGAAPQSSIPTNTQNQSACQWDTPDDTWIHSDGWQHNIPVPAAAHTRS